jgi:hypothetical protein
VSLSLALDDVAIRRTLSEYCQCCDAGDFEALLDVFVADGELVYGARVARGHAALLTFFRELQGRPEQRGRHLTLNSIIDLAGDRASVRSDFLVLRFDDGRLTPAITGSYRDALVRCDKRWRIERREILPLRAAG